MLPVHELQVWEDSEIVASKEFPMILVRYFQAQCSICNAASIDQRRNEGLVWRASIVEEKSKLLSHFLQSISSDSLELCSLNERAAQYYRSLDHHPYVQWTTRRDASFQRLFSFFVCPTVCRSDSVSNTQRWVVEKWEDKRVHFFLLLRRRRTLKTSNWCCLDEQILNVI